MGHMIWTLARLDWGARMWALSLVNNNQATHSHAHQNSENSTPRRLAVTFASDNEVRYNVAHLGRDCMHLRIDSVAVMYDAKLARVVALYYIATRWVGCLLRISKF